MLPRRLASHEDVRGLVQEIVQFWMTAYVQSVPEPLPTQEKKRAEDALARNGAVLEPDVFVSLHRLIRSYGDPAISYTFKQSDAEMGWSRPETLGNFLFLPDEYYESLSQLLRWCNHEASVLEKALKVTLFWIDDEIPEVEAIKPPPSMIDQNLLVQQAVLRHRQIAAVKARLAAAQSSAK